MDDGDDLVDVTASQRVKHKIKQQKSEICVYLIFHNVVNHVFVVVWR